MQSVAWLQTSQNTFAEMRWWLTFACFRIYTTLSLNDRCILLSFLTQTVKHLSFIIYNFMHEFAQKRGTSGTLLNDLLSALTRLIHKHIIRYVHNFSLRLESREYSTLKFTIEVSCSSLYIRCFWISQSQLFQVPIIVRWLTNSWIKNGLF